MRLPAALQRAASGRQTRPGSRSHCSRFSSQVQERFGPSNGPGLRRSIVAAAASGAGSWRALTDETVSRTGQRIPAARRASRTGPEDLRERQIRSAIAGRDRPTANEENGLLGGILACFAVAQSRYNILPALGARRSHFAPTSCLVSPAMSLGKSQTDVPPHGPLIRWLIAWLAMVCGPPGAAMAAEIGGDEIYRQQCGKCHGAAGEGVKDHGKPLLGDKSLVELAAYVAENMPDDDPGTVSGDDARKVSEFIYHAFYSPVAQARNQPARNELSRLTAQQYRNAVADLVGSFAWSGDWNSERGLKAEYYKSENSRREDLAFERIDRTVDFHFGEGSPDPRVPAESFSITWRGGVLVARFGRI